MKLASLFQDHAVLQRQKPIPVWGTGEPGEKVVVRLAGLEAETVVDSRGRWMLRLSPLPAGGPFTLSAEAPSGGVSVNDILIGEVWIASGQSNMEWTLTMNGVTEVDGDPSSFQQIRVLTVKNPAEVGTADEVKGVWRCASQESLLEFSAVAGFFGRRLQEELNVPIGLICNAWGGTRIQAWMSREALMLEPEGRDEIGYYESTGVNVTAPRTIAEWEETLAPQDPGNSGLAQGWASPNFDDSTWEKMPLPALWQNLGYDFSGIFWFRKSLPLPAAWVGQELELSLGAIDKCDDTWANECHVGSMSRTDKDAWCTPRLYKIAGLSTNNLTVAVRAQSHLYHGGMNGPAEAMWVAPVGAAPSERLSLAGDWKFKVEVNWGKVVPPPMEWGSGNPNSPAILFENRIAPLIPYAFRGVIWYQGESNVGEANLYRRFIAAMIQDWRRAWGAGAFPFIQVQLANYMGAATTPTPESGWAALREAQNSALSLEATGIAVAIDIGEANDIHPRNKRDVGLRLAQSALHNVYRKKEIEPMGPLFETMTQEPGGKIRCTFRHTGGGLVAKGGEPLRHFAIAGRERVFHWADAVIDGDSVVVSSPKVLRPYAVRYAWADNPEGCNLFSAEGLPASPFRTDAWPVN